LAEEGADLEQSPLLAPARSQCCGPAHRMTARGRAVRLADGPYPGSVFLASTETYDLFNTCNTWTAAVLNDAGLPIDPRVLLADQVMQQVDRIATLQARQRR